MSTQTPKGRALAIAAGAAFTAGGLTILLGDVLTKPEAWTSYHALTILTVFGTIAAGHLLVDAWRTCHVLAALGFLVLFMSGTGLVVYQSVGRQAETTDAKALDAEASNMMLASKGADLAKAKSRFDDANRMADSEMRGERCGPRCKDWRQRATEVQALISQIEDEIYTLGPQKPVAPKAEKMAAVAALFGADQQKAKAALMLLEPFLWTLFFEIGSIVSLGFAFRSGPAPIPVIKETLTPEKPTIPCPPPVSKKRRRFPETNVVDFHSHKVLKALEGERGPVSNARLAQLLGETEGEASKSWREVSEHLEIGRQGKELRIALKRTG
jgi:hypothetical protein